MIAKGSISSIPAFAAINDRNDATTVRLVWYAVAASNTTSDCKVFRLLRGNPEACQSEPNQTTTMFRFRSETLRNVCLLLAAWLGKLCCPNQGSQTIRQHFRESKTVA
jgi:hypothetical protein